MMYSFDPIQTIAKLTLYILALIIYTLIGFYYDANHGYTYKKYGKEER